MIFVLLPFAMFTLAFLFGAVILWQILKKSRTMIGRDGALHIEHRLGTLDIQPKKQPDPELKAVLVYPGALRNDAENAEIQLDITFGSKHAHFVNASYWTPDPVERVWEFYRRELPAWSVNVTDYTGRELVDCNGGLQRKIRVYRDSDRTIIDTSVAR